MAHKDDRHLDILRLPACLEARPANLPCRSRRNYGPVFRCLWYRRPCPNEIPSMQRFEEELGRYSCDTVGKVITGDMNVHNFEWLMHSISYQYRGPRARGRVLFTRVDATCERTDAWTISTGPCHVEFLFRDSL